MSIFGAIFEAISVETAPTVLGLSTPGTSDFANPQPWLVEALGGGSTAAGKRVTPANAMRVSAVYGCVTALAKPTGQIPLQVMRTSGNGGADVVDDHPLTRILSGNFNPLMTSQDCIETAMVHLCLRGKAYFQIVRDGFGNVLELWPLHPDFVRMYWAPNGSLMYEYDPPSGGREVYEQNEVWRIIGMTFDGIQGVSPITYAREAIGLSMATEEHGAKLFANGAQLATAFEHPSKLGVEQYQRIKQSIDDRFAGSKHAFKSIILEDGMKVSKLAMTSSDAQYIELRKYQLEEICRIFGVPQHKVQNLDRATFNNIEHLTMDFVNSSLMPWFQRFQKTGYRDLLLPKEQKKLFLRFDADSLTQADSQAAANVASVLIAARVWSPNEARLKLGMKPYAGGDTYENPNTTSSAAKKVGDTVPDTSKG